MRQLRRQYHLLRVLLLFVLLLSACSSQQDRWDDDFVMGTKDPFADSFFTHGQQWDSSTLAQSEVLSQDVPKDSEEPTTWVEKSEAALMAAVMVGGGVAKFLFLPFLGL